MRSFSISYWNLIKISLLCGYYYWKRGKGGEREGGTLHIYNVNSLRLRKYCHKKVTHLRNKNKLFLNKSFLRFSPQPRLLWIAKNLQCGYNKCFWKGRMQNVYTTVFGFSILAACLRLGTSKKNFTLHFHGSLCFFWHNGILKHEDNMFLVRNPLHFGRVSCSYLDYFSCPLD
jgi:hypothetical protein